MTFIETRGNPDRPHFDPARCEEFTIRTFDPLINVEPGIETAIKRFLPKEYYRMSNDPFGARLTTIDTFMRTQGETLMSLSGSQREVYLKDFISTGSYHEQVILGEDITEMASTFGQVRSLDAKEVNSMVTTNQDSWLPSVISGDFSRSTWCVVTAQEGSLLLFQARLDDRFDMVILDDFFKQDPEFLQTRLRRYCEVAAIDLLQHTLNVRRAMHSVKPEDIVPATIRQMVGEGSPKDLVTPLQYEAGRIGTFSRLLVAANPRISNNLADFLEKLQNAGIRLDSGFSIMLDNYLEHRQICPGADSSEAVYVSSLKSALHQLKASLKWAISPENKNPLPSHIDLSVEQQAILAKTSYSLREVVTTIFSATANKIIDLNNPAHYSFITSLFPLVDQQVWDGLK